ncbi:unnamed protein product [Moneuplotes crassus]|uniref:Uncharacterized protein n=1 Tax=Euplotes crassus TaxID=5936 RepID=A0AAD1Y6W2_EUPCR|nr:unnamed protein product [Moneuplotes crassus]
MKGRISKEIFTNISSIANVLPYLDYPDMCHHFMMEFRKESRQMWKKHIYKWSSLLSAYKRKAFYLFLDSLLPVTTISPEIFLKYQFREIYSVRDIETLTKKIKQSLPIEISEIILSYGLFHEVMVTEEDIEETPQQSGSQVYSFIDKLNQLVDVINMHQKKLGLQKLVLQDRNFTSGRNYTIFKLPEIFQIPRGSWKYKNMHIYDSSMNLDLDESIDNVPIDKLNSVIDSCHQINSEKGINTFFNPPKNQRVAHFASKEEITIECWNSPRKPKLFNNDILQCLKKKCVRLKRFEFMFNETTLIHKWRHSIDQIQKIFPKIYLGYEGLEPGEDILWQLRCRACTFTKIQDNKKIIYYLDNCNINLNSSKEFYSQGCIRIKDKFNFFGKIHATEIENNSSESTDAEQEVDSKESKSSDFHDEKAIITVRVEDILNLGILFQDFEKDTKKQSFMNHLLENEHMNKRALRMYGELYFNTSFQTSQPPEYKCESIYLKAAEKMNLNSLIITKTDSPSDAIRVIEGIVQKSTNLQQVCVSFCITPTEIRKSIIPKMITLMKSCPYICNIISCFPLNRPEEKDFKKLYISPFQTLDIIITDLF